MNETLDVYYQPNKTFPEIRELMKTGTFFNPLSEFAEAAREELRILSSATRKIWQHHSSTR